MTSIQRYARPLALLHWLMALLIVGTFLFGLKVGAMPLSPAKFHQIAWHKWAGITVLLLLMLRIAVRLASRVPPLPDTMSALAQKAAHVGHFALYALMLAVPLSGWAMSSAYGFPVVYFQLLPLPDLVAKDPALAETLLWVHRGCNVLLAVTVLGHVAAALKHQWLDKDGLLSRMSLR